MNLIKYLEIEDHKNVYVVGDLHGCYSMLMTKLKELNFDFKNDVLLSVGDLVDRGPENEQCISLINEDWFHAVTGNHEDFCILGATDFRIEVHHKAGNNGGGWLYKYNEAERIEIVKPFKELPLMMEVKWKGKKFGLVHADLPVQDWDVLKLMVENDDEWHHDRSIRDHIIWSRNLVNYSYAEIANIDYVFLGHTVLNSHKFVGNAIFIDTGAVFGGGRELTIMNLKDFL